MKIRPLTFEKWCQFVSHSSSVCLSLLPKLLRFQNKGLPTMAEKTVNKSFSWAKEKKDWPQIEINFSSHCIGKLSRCPYRAATEYYVPEIGYQLYRMLHALKLDLRSLNCIGHSLGSHIVCIIILIRIRYAYRCQNVKREKKKVLRLINFLFFFSSRCAVWLCWCCNGWTISTLFR